MLNPQLRKKKIARKLVRRKKELTLRNRTIGGDTEADRDNRYAKRLTRRLTK